MLRGDFLKKSIKKVPGARPAQTSSLLHLMRIDVPEDHLRILETDKSRKEPCRGFSGVE